MEFSLASRTASKISNSVTRLLTPLIFFSTVSENWLRKLVVLMRKLFTRSKVKWIGTGFSVELFISQDPPR